MLLFAYNFYPSDNQAWHVNLTTKRFDKVLLVQQKITFAKQLFGLLIIMQQ